MTFKNYKKRKQKQHQELMKQASQDIMLKFIKEVMGNDKRRNNRGNS